jgi:serine protease Do
MKGFTHAALAGALTLAPGIWPAATTTATAQESEPMVRALQIARGSRIGASVQDLEQADTKKGPSQGISIETVEPGGPADKAGVKAGDVVTEFDGEKVRSVRQFSRLVQETPPGRSVGIVLSRGGQRVTASLTVERAGWGDDFSMRLLESPRIPRPAMPPAPPAAPATPRVPSVAPAAPFDVFRFTTGRRLGVTIETLDDQLAQFFGVKEGVLVRSVETDSTAAKAGVKAGDVMTSINGRQVYEVGDVNRALDRVEGDGDVTIEVVRDHKPQTLKGKLETRRGRGSVTMF